MATAAPRGDIRVAPPQAQPAPPELREARFWDTPVAWWAALGALLMVGEAYIFIRWLFSNDLRDIPAGPTPVPSWMKVTLVLSCIGIIGGFLLVMWRWCFKPWRTTGQLTTLGAFGLGTWTMFWQDPLQNQIAPWFSWNHWLPNVGSWANEIPGVSQVNATGLGEPLYITATGFVLFYFGFGAVFGSFVMKKVNERRPGIGTPWLILASILACTVSLGVLELFWMRAGAYIYPDGIKQLTLFYGHTYQIPIYEIVIDGILAAGMSWVVYFRNDKGETFVERGLSKIKLSPAKKNVMRILAFAVAANLVYAMYSLTLQPFLHAGHSWPADIAKRSYFAEGWCGPGPLAPHEVRMACFSNSLPLPTRGSAVVLPNGTLVPGRHPIPKPVPFLTTTKGQ
jgi:Spirocyclase AveC-like